MVKTFTNQLVTEGANVTPPTVWALNIIIQRLCICHIFSHFYNIFNFNNIKENYLELKKLLINIILVDRLLFLFLGISILAFSFFGTFIHFPYNWDRTSIFGWIFVIPATLILIDEYNLKNKFVKIIIICSIVFLIFGNLYSLPSNIFDHKGDAKYTGSFENWETNQEYLSAQWLSENSINKTFSADETFNRAYSVTDPMSIQNNYSYNLMSNYFNITNMNSSYNNSTFSYLILRSENRFYITGDLSSNSPLVDKFTPQSLNKMFSDPQMDLIYDNNEIKIFKSNNF